MKKYLDQIGLLEYTTGLVNKLKTIFPSQSSFNTVDQRSQQSASDITTLTTTVNNMKAKTPGYIVAVKDENTSVEAFSARLDEDVGVSFGSDYWTYESGNGLKVLIYFRVAQGVNVLKICSREFYGEFDIIRTGATGIDWFRRKILTNSDSMNRINGTTTATNPDMIKSLVDFVPAQISSYAADNAISTVAGYIYLPGYTSASSFSKVTWVQVEMSKQ